MGKRTKELLANATRPARPVSICLDGRIAAEIDATRAELEAAREAPPGSTSLDGSPTVAIQRRLAELEERAKAKTVDFWVEALPREEFTALIATHPPREGVARDVTLGFNEEAVDTALVLAGVTTDDGLDDEDREMLRKLAPGQFNKLISAAWTANQRDVDVPFSSAASASPPISEPE